MIAKLERTLRTLYQNKEKTQHSQAMEATIHNESDTTEPPPADRGLKYIFRLNILLNSTVV